MNWLSILLPALTPALTDGVRSIIGKFTGSAGAQPQNVAEAIQLMTAQTDRVKALAELDKLPDGAAPWVINLRGAFRYVAVGGIELAALAAVIFGVQLHVPDAVQLVLLDLAGSCMSFIIGERMYLNLKGNNR